ncbi:MAG: hypothetical protein AB1815_10585 [Bacillota bacterium]
MDSANIQRGLNPPLNEVSFKPGQKIDILCGRPIIKAHPGLDLVLRFRRRGSC